MGGPEGRYSGTMRQTKHGFCMIDFNDNMSEFPDTFNSNVEKVIEKIDALTDRIENIRKEVDDLKRLYYYGGDPE